MLSSLRSCTRLAASPSANLALRRGLALSCASQQKASDPIQQLFVDKVREYADKKAKAGGKLVDADPVVEKNLQKELEKVRQKVGCNNFALGQPAIFRMAVPRHDSGNI